MKSFSSSSFASENAVALEFAADAVKDNPYALFTDFQWFLLTGRDTVFFTAFSKTSFDKAMLQDLVAQDGGAGAAADARLQGRQARPAVPAAHARRHHLGRGGRQLRGLSRQVADGRARMCSTIPTCRCSA